MPKPICDCPCGARPTIEGDSMTGMFAVECANCARITGAKGRVEAVRMWNAACCNMTDAVSTKVNH